VPASSLGLAIGATEVNGAYPPQLTHIEVRQHPKWHGLTTPPDLGADAAGEPIYDDPADAGAASQDTDESDTGAA
jgi:hypothetical protein